MPANQFFQEWPDEHKNTPYPFVDTATLRDVGGELLMQNQYFVDAKFWPTTSSGRVYLRSVERKPTSLKLSIHDLEGELMTAEIPSFQFSNEVIVFKDSGGFQTGFLKTAPGALSAIHDHPNGTYRFAVRSTEFVASAVATRRSRGISSFRDDQDNTLEENIRVVGGQGIELEVVGSVVQVNAIGDALFRRDTCDDPDWLGLVINPLRRIRWQDLRNDTSGFLKGENGHLLTRIITSGEDRGFASPDGDGSFVGMVL